MTRVSGTGLWPGSDALEAASVVVGDLVDLPDGVVGLPFVPTLPARGPWGDRVGTAAGVLVELPVELGPHGWKLADRPGSDLGRVQAYAREDLDALAVAAHGYAGPLVLPVLGPLTLAASVYLARGDRVLSDTGAVRELAESFAAGLAERLLALRRAVPGASVQVLLHEPLLAQVLAGVLPTFSGYAALRRVAVPDAAERLAVAVSGARAGGAGVVAVHGGTAWSSLAALRSTGADAFGLAVAGLDEPGWERVAEAVEGGMRLWAEVPSQASSQCAGPDVVGQADVLTRPWSSLGLPAAGLADVVVLAGDPPAQASPDDARAALAGAVRCARLVIERSDA
ncbi:uroporphyrinogen decarboxylase/cobalamine-independent methonine synthase family protein [Cellulomonas edaphi]|uniref:Methionine synthase n=1 Tax=Cellulomonas edaphi TaxID=3053468 RepID=A0ABT7SBL3_9CELL|nr:hypothetical protein [Cellulomons edaphi]MDM7832387.1 hypothetical protein [Cellulomons edaphi]